PQRGLLSEIVRSCLVIIRFRVIDTKMHQLAGYGKTMLARENFDCPQMWHKTKTFPQDAQKDQTFHPPNPGGYFTRPP
ncbi:MAG: hypothetical protein ACREI1_09050, partial [Nitrospiraceae bacterium]